MIDDTIKNDQENSNSNANHNSENSNSKTNMETGSLEEKFIEENTSSKFQEFFSEIVNSENPKITDTLLTFLELKNVDEELSEIEDEKGDLPETIETIKTKINFLEAELTERKHSLLKIEDDKTKFQKSNNACEEKINKYDEQKFNVRSNKEYDEIVKTIDSLFEEVEKNEIRIKEIDEMTKTLSLEAESLDNEIKVLQAELDEKQSLLNELNQQFQVEESILKKKRTDLLSKLSAESSSLYERINRMYRGEATAIVRKGNCSGCYNSIPPQRVIEIKTVEKIFTCQSCGRILIAEEIITG